jgi:deoxyribose-phosphate aldolase
MTMSSRNSELDAKSPARDWQSVAKIIDHTLLKAEATPEQVAKLCEEAREYGFGAVMVNATNVAQCFAKLQGSAVKVGAVIGFPLGATLTSVKVFEANECMRLGAREIDMVMNVGALKSGHRDLVRADIEAVATAVHARNGLMKVILETGLLTDDEKRAACEICEKAGADFVKTSTGFLGGVATVEDVALMRRAVTVGVKASGGIRSAADALKMIEAGATRLGTSGGVAIVRELRDGEVAASQKSAY